MVRPPKNNSDKAEQLRPPIVKGLGETPTERELIRLSERSFLDLWSFPNLYRNQKNSGGGDGKELCDLLVVCDPHVIIFSEKNIRWPDKPVEVAWSRWAKKALKNSLDQIRGAERWLSDFPDRIFLDRQCTESLPINLPPPNRRIIHRVVVARGAGEACKSFFNGGTGSLAIMPEIVGSDHWNPTTRSAEPFMVGDLDPNGAFVHVFDDGSLNTVMHELDTISDFTDYLSKKAEFVRSGRLIAAHGEEDLLAYYAVRINEDGDHDFAPPDHGSWENHDAIAIDGSHFSELIQNPQYIAKKHADEVSYVWDTLIKNFTDHMLAGTSIVPDGYEYDLRNSERAVRHMALENRFKRRSHGEAIQGAMKKSWEVDKFFRAMIPAEGSREDETGFFFLTMKYLDWMEDLGGYDHYRLKRVELATAYAKGMLIRYPYLKRIVGISAEPPRQGRGSSEDILYAEQIDWTDEEKQEIRQLCDELEILKPGYQERKWTGQEFPEVAFAQRSTSPGLNRKERRARKAKMRRRSRKPRK